MTLVKTKVYNQIVEGEKIRLTELIKDKPTDAAKIFLMAMRDAYGIVLADLD